MHNTCTKHGKDIKTPFFFGVDINLALKKGLKFYQTRSNAIILYETLPPYCIPKVVRMESGEIIYEKVYASPRPPPKISLKHDWMKELGSEVVQRPEGEVVQQSKSSQSTQPDADHDRTGKPVVCHQRGALRSQEIETRSFREEAAKHDRTEKPVVCCVANHERSTAVCSEQTTHPRFSRESQNLILEEETNHDRTVRPVVCRDACHAQGHEQSMLYEVDIDFRIPGLPHSVVKQPENYRVRELVKKIENHPHRQSLQRDLQQNKSCNPFSTTSKKMIQDMGNVELFELFETDLKTQCKDCLSYWSEGIVYCTCGHLLRESAANRRRHPIYIGPPLNSNYVIKKGRPHGHRYGKTTKQREHFIAQNLRKRCIKRRFQGIHHHFLNDPEFRASQLEHHRDEEVCIKWDDLAEQDFSHYVTESEYFRYKQNW